MTDRFNTLSFRQLFEIVQKQLQKKQFFGIPDALFFKPESTDTFKTRYLNQALETPLGVAAGPHTQLAQNIVASWLCGARFIELKTIQTLDELEVSKPCIDMQDEGYNCEWSQELKIMQSYEQYLDAWILIHILQHELHHEHSSGIGTIFNMSVGYDLKGILQDNVQKFFSKMKNCSQEKNQKLDEIRDIYPQIDELNIPDCISDNITLSTMHGCPPEEIEQIGLYLLKEKKLHTNIKLNPTLLGKKELKEILDNSGFKTQVPDLAFEHDLKYADARQIIRNLQKEADHQHLHFGLKLTNTLESKNHKSIFPTREKMMYMSGKALHAISVNLAVKLQKDFDGRLNISFSGGANAENISSLIASGLYPVTVCSDILKPGGYSLLGQYLQNLKQDIANNTAHSINELISHKAKIKNYNDAALTNLVGYADAVLHNKAYHRSGWSDPTIKTCRSLTRFDCVQAPCVDTCPTNQDIPDYLYHTARGDFNKAFEVIMRTNPFPNSTGMVCDHLCQSRCTRINYDEPVRIRDVKRFIAEQVSQANHSAPDKSKSSGKKVAIIGAGPSGLSAAYFLTIGGMEVELFEIQEKPGGMVSGAIPNFRLTDEAFNIDLERIRSLGVKIHYNSLINSHKFKQIREAFDYTYIAVGAAISRKFSMKGIETSRTLDPLEFLFAVKQNKKTSIGKNVLIIGGGNTAMDTARTAFRMVGQSGKVSILYRRNIEDMPADQGEIRAVLDEGVQVMERVLPIGVKSLDGKLHTVQCIRMELLPSNEGRPKPVAIPNSEFELKADTIIPAIGQDLDIDFIESDKLKSKPGVYETKIPGVFIGGDALRGASTAINAIGDGRKVSRMILEKAGLDGDSTNLPKREKTNIRDIMKLRAKKVHAIPTHELPLTQRKNFNLVNATLTVDEAIAEAKRCLQCDELCNTCTTVCPNLALIQYNVNPTRIKLQKINAVDGKIRISEDENFEIKQRPQILHLADWCNECGNCDTFCPTEGAPYKVKPHLYLNKEAFESDNEGYYFDTSKDCLIYKSAGIQHELSEEGESYTYKIGESTLVLNKNTFKIDTYHNIQTEEIKLTKAIEMSIVLQGVHELF